MNNKLYGDVSQADKLLVEELKLMEDFIDDNKSRFHPADIAKLLVCCAHDWYDVGLEDKGYELLNEAEQARPGYFEKEIAEDINNDSAYKMLVENLTKHIMSIVTSTLEEKKKQ